MIPFSTPPALSSPSPSSIFGSACAQQRRPALKRYLGRAAKRRALAGISRTVERCAWPSVLTASRSALKFQPPTADSCVARDSASNFRLSSDKYLQSYALVVL